MKRSVNDPNGVLFPTTMPLDFVDLIKVRCVPIGFIGIESRIVWADRHYQSPADFMWHDINHIRRMFGSTNGITKNYNKQERFQEYEKMNTLVTLVLQETERNDDTSREIGIKQIIRAIFFEIVHESALAPTQELIL